MMFLIIYLIIGVAITELTANEIEEYNEYIRSDHYLYLLEVLTWLPDLFNFFTDDDDHENLGY